MFIIDQQPVPYSDPWTTPFEQRIAALNKGRRRVAYFYEFLDNSTFRYRCYNMIQALEQSDSSISAAYFCDADIDQLCTVVDCADVLVICRARYSHKLNRAITRARGRGVKVFFDVDDLVIDPTYVHLVMETLDQDVTQPVGLDVWFASFGRMNAALALCDSAITTNPYLAEKISRCSGKTTQVIPNFMNREQIDISKAIYKQKCESNFRRDGKLHLGYFSGTPTHNRDFDIVCDALVRILHDYPEATVLIAGYLELRGELKNYADRVQFFPFQDFVNLQRLIGSVEINLMPLQDNAFTNCKSELKYFEAGVVGSISVASPVYTYRTSISDGDNGYLANSIDWYDKLRTIMDSMENYPAMAHRAYEHSERRYAWYNQIELIERTLFA